LNSHGAVTETVMGTESRRVEPVVSGSGLRALGRRVWERWKVIAHVIGNFQARVLLTAFYFLIVPPFALIVKIFKDPLGLRPPAGESLWLERPAPEPAAESGRRQF
jgi:hypothetical protein